MTEDEAAELDVVEEGDACKRSGLEFVAFPIADRGVPESRPRTVELARRLDERLRAGRRVAVHCRQGVGRSALIAACLLVGAGVEPAVAFERVRVARGCPVPDTQEQREWVARLADELAGGEARPSQ